MYLIRSRLGRFLRGSLLTPQQSGDSPVIPLVDPHSPPEEVKDRWKVVEKMELVTQYTFAGDYTGEVNAPPGWDNSLLIFFVYTTVEAIDKAVTEVAKFDAGESLRL